MTSLTASASATSRSVRPPGSWLVRSITTRVLGVRPVGVVVRAARPRRPPAVMKANASAKSANTSSFRSSSPSTVQPSGTSSRQPSREASQPVFGSGPELEAIPIQEAVHGR